MTMAPAVIMQTSPIQTNMPPFTPVSATKSEEPQPSNRNRCPYPDCGRVFKDLAAHMLTHMEERPEKCPIETCEYHTKGFARKYDKNRHALTHYKGTMVCPFCPGAGTAYEKAFNRADVFKRHLTAVHNVEQTPPNSRKLVLSTAGSRSAEGADGHGRVGGAKCSICQSQFLTAQEFYEHLDDCVLNVIVPPTPKSAGGVSTVPTSATSAGPMSAGPMSAGPTSATTMTTMTTMSNRKDSMRTPTTANTERSEMVREAEMELDDADDKADYGYERDREPRFQAAPEAESKPAQMPEAAMEATPISERERHELETSAKQASGKEAPGLEPAIPIQASDPDPERTRGTNRNQAQIKKRRRRATTRNRPGKIQRTHRNPERKTTHGKNKTHKGRKR